MLEKVQIEAKSKEEALEKALEQLNVRKDETFYYFGETEGGLFKGKKYVVTVTTKYAIKEYIKEFLRELASKMNTKFSIEVKETEVGFNVLIIADDNATLIGKDGNTLNSIQTVLRQAIRKEGNFDLKINLDISDYKARKESRIEREAKRLCREVKKTKMEVKLDPMNSYERRLVHNVVSKFDCLETHSEGEGKERHVIISYKEE